ncbi:MAG: hypothetical protein GX488_02115 [Clostridiales bacterium]|nr:hypothetical protein [Clostridiales bacterium]
MYILIAILIFGFLIVTHELGHFLLAKAFNVYVNEFAVGMGPALFRKKHGETYYALRVLPIGGFCAMDEDEESDNPRAFTNPEWWKRFFILFAGAAMNFLTGLVILAFIVPRSPAFMTPAITGFFENCPYEGENGFMENDILYKIDGHRVFFSSDISLLLSRNDSETHDFTLIRNGKKVELEDFRFVPVEYEINGEKVMKYGLYFGIKEKGFFAGAKYTWNSAKNFVRMVWMGLSDLLTGTVGLRELSGPVGIVDIINDVGESSETPTAAAYSIAYLAAFIAVNLAVMNLLPLPALDGGRLLFLLVNAAVEGIFKKKLNPKYEGYVHAAGFVLLLGLMAIVMINDIYKLIS